MSEARRLLERAKLHLIATIADGDRQKVGVPNVRLALADIDAYLAQPMTKCTELLNELHHFHELTGMDGIEFEKVLDEATGLRDWTGTPNGALFLALLAREGELVAALEDARMLCMNDHAYDNETSQVFEAVQVINRALADTPPAAAALLAQGERQRLALKFYADEDNWEFNEGRDCCCGGPLRECHCPAPADDDGARARAALAPGGSPSRD